MAEVKLSSKHKMTRQNRQEISSSVAVHSVKEYDLETLVHVVKEAMDLLDSSVFQNIRSKGKKGLVVLKPNWVQESHEYNHDAWEAVITNPALLLATILVLRDRLQGAGTRLVICDGPHTYANFATIVARGELRKKVSSLLQQGVNLEILDLRREIWRRKDQVVVERLKNSEDPRGYVALNLGKHSLLYGHKGEGRFYGADYDSGVVNDHHRGERQEYLLAGTAMQCDLFINLPKMKTHKKTGITCALKNLVGINGDKNWLPHHTGGNRNHGGDEFLEYGLSQRIERTTKNLGLKLALGFPMVGTWFYRKTRNAGIRILGDSEKVIRNGNWSGNNTCWRMALDLNRALLYGNPDGTWRESGDPKPYLSIVDGVIGGEGNGPLCPDPINSNILVAGTDPAAIDAVAARLMGFDPQKLPIVRHAFDSHRWPISTQNMSTIRVMDDRVGHDIALRDIAPSVAGGFTPHFGWNDIRYNRSNDL